MIFEKTSAKKQIIINPPKYSSLFFYAALLLLAPALFTNLGIMPTLGDEATRAMVALEFLIKDDLIAPTINGEYYLNKPPVYNWIMVFIFKYTGYATEFYIRLPAVVSLILFAITIYLTSKKILGNKFAIINAFAFITFGRMLFYDSMLGHIDILFSLIVYLAIFSIWYYSKNKNNYKLFIISYLLTAIAFLMKGLPSIVFLAGSFAALIILDRNIKRFLSVAHAMGILTFLLIVGTYFYLYSFENSLLDLTKTLWNESSKRTAFENEAWRSIQYFLTFPFEYFFHLIPWSFLVISCFRKDTLKIIKSNPYILFCALTIGINLIVYWISPETRPRYLFAIIPFIFTLLLYCYQIPGAEKQKGLTHILIYATFIFFTLASLLPLVVNVPADIPYKTAKTIAFFGGFLAITILSFKIKSQKLILLIVLLLVARIEFDLFVLPSREKEAHEAKARKDILAMQLPEDLPIYIYKNADIRHSVSYYLTRERRKIIKRDWDGQRKDVYYIVKDYNLPEYPFKEFAQFNCEGQIYYIVKK